MTISHELISEIATAILADKDRSPQEIRELKETVLRVQEILEEMTNAERAARYAKFIGEQD